MALVAFPLESGMTGFDDYGNPIFDRAVTSVFYRTFWRKYFTDGIFYDPSDNFKVSPAGGMKVSVKLGECHIRGLTAAPDEETEEIITIDGSSATVDRTDRIVIRADFESDRSVTVRVKKGWKAGDTLERNSNAWELAIADIFVGKTRTEILALNITDLRLNTELCGVVAEPLVRTNTQDFFTRLGAELDRIAGEWSSQKSSQQSSWKAQLDAQDIDYRTLRTDIASWYALVRADIVKLQTFDFDNIAAIPGCTRKTTFAGTSPRTITETITVTGAGTPVATRVTTINGSNITEKLTVFDTDGVTILHKTESQCVIGTEVVETVQ